MYLRLNPGPSTPNPAPNPAPQAASEQRRHKLSYRIGPLGAGGGDDDDAAAAVIARLGAELKAEGLSAKVGLLSPGPEPRA